jgi:hypothetical protein
LQCLHAAALVAPWTSALPVPLCAVASLAALLGSIRLRRAWREEAQGWQISVREGQWMLAGDGVELPAELMRESVIWPGFVVLQLRVGGRLRSLVLLEDSCSADELRRLRVLARMSSPVSAGSRA